MPLRRFVEVEPPSPLRYIIGAAIMMLGVVLPVGYMMFRNKRVPSSSSSYAKQTLVYLVQMSSFLQCAQQLHGSKLLVRLAEAQAAYRTL
ncbi:hypothetical protein RJ639_017103 [Escallonia herrerae]|uniref:Uncharacterized protein n=1 Tax=Escallonia herrerae TaxID=1293975 RepID=A0AA88VBG6_9ASTE|nr:hypothetical protein RJ639_017103 [Escallonia herrerae]